VAVFPTHLPDGGRNFNNLHLAAGWEAVSGIVKAAIDTHQASQLAPQATQTDKPAKAASVPKTSQAAMLVAF
jgi:putative DNA primase/helicase